MNTRDVDSRSRQVFTAATAAIVLSLIWGATLRGQGSPATRAPMAEDVFKNVQVLKGIPVDQFMGTELTFPTRITQMLMQVRVGFPTSINDRNIQVIQGTTDGGTLVTMYFDTETGL